MNGWKIVRIPTVSKLTNECFDLYSSMRNVLYATYNVAGNSSSIEIVFSHEKQGEVSIYLFSHSAGAFDSQHIISQHLTTASYQFEVLDSYAIEIIYSSIMDNSTRGCYAVGKTRNWLQQDMSRRDTIIGQIPYCGQAIKRRRILPQFSRHC